MSPTTHKAMVAQATAGKPPITPPTSLPGAGLLADNTPITAPQPGGQVLTVGVGGQFATIAAAVAAAHDGDVIRIAAGTYVNDFATISARVTIEGAGGMVHLVATQPPPNDKGIFTVDADCTIKNLSFSGCAIADSAGGNGAGIRYEGGQMTLQNCAFANNQDGILAFPTLGLASNTITIDHCLFSGNGSGTGYTHNLYVGAVSSLTVSNSVFENANVGHEFKSRALVNTIEGNIFRDGPTGTASYSIDLPNGGQDTVIGNIIEKGPNAENNGVIHFGGEGLPYAGSSLLVQGNTIINDHGGGTIGVFNQTAISATITGNAFDNFAGATIAQGPATETGNVDEHGNALPDSTLTGVLPGNTLVITDANPHSVTLDNTLQAVEGGAGLLTVYAAGGHVIAIGGSGGMNYAESQTSGGNQITTATGSVNGITLTGQDLVDSEGTDRIIGGSGNITGLLAGHATVDDGVGNDAWQVTGWARIAGHGGNPVCNVGAHGNLGINGTLGYLEVQNNGGRFGFDVRIAGVRLAANALGGALDVRLYNNMMNITTASGGSGTTLFLSVGDAQVTSRGHDVIWAGAGHQTVIVQGNAEIHAGRGQLTIFDHGSPGATVYGNGGTYRLDGDTGNITYVGGALASTLNLVLSGNTILGGAGLLTVNGGSREIITGGGGGLVYTATDGGGANTITTQAGAIDTLTLSGGDVVESWGQDVIYGGSANQVLDIHGNSTVLGSLGTSTVSFWGRDTLIGAGQDQVSVQAGADATITAGQFTNVVETAATAHVSTGSASAVLRGGAGQICNNADGSLQVTTSHGNATDVAIGGGNVTVTALGGDTIEAGSGTDVINIDASNSQIWGGGGSLSVTDNDWTPGSNVTIHGGTGSLTYTQGNGQLTFLGGAGDAVIDGAYGSLVIQGGAGDLTVTGGNGGTTFTGGSGAASLSLTPGGGDVTFGSGNTSVLEAAWGAADIFSLVAGQGGGSDSITGFRNGIDQVVLHGVDVASQQANAGGTLVLFTDGTSLQLAGISDTSHVFVHAA